MKKTPLKRKTPLRAKSGFKQKPRKPLKRSKLRKHSKQKISVLKRHLWEVFSKFIRQRDNNTCFICGRKGSGGSSIQAGHFIPKSVGGLALYFNEDNVHACCYNCNINLGGNLYEYGIKLGPEKVFYLKALQHQFTEISADEYQNKINHYTNLLKEI